MQNIDPIYGKTYIKGYHYYKNRQVLDVTSNCGTVYQYFEVPETILKELSNAIDPGEYYRKNIRRKFRRMFKSYGFSG